MHLFVRRNPLAPKGSFEIQKNAVRKIVFGPHLLLILLLAPLLVHAQIDPDKRTLFQLGYNQPLVGKGPLAAYAFYFRNQPDFLSHSNLTLRLAVAPVYVDSELGIRGALGENTDVGLGVAGGGFADSYYEINGGQYLKGQSFIGHGGLVSASVYHLFDPGQKIPLSGVFHVIPHYSVYDRDSDTAPNFVLPHDHLTISTRAGLRLGGREPVMIPDVALELSVWVRESISHRQRSLRIQWRP